MIIISKFSFICVYKAGMKDLRDFAQFRYFYFNAIPQHYQRIVYVVQMPQQHQRLLQCGVKMPQQYEGITICMKPDFWQLSAIP